MGFAISWLGVRGLPAEEVLTQLGLRRTDAAAGCDAALTTVATHGGWTIVFSNEFDPPLFADDSCRRLSAAAEVVRVHVEEHVMFAAASFWQGGACRWQVERDCQKDFDHLEATGDLPPFFAPIEREQKQKQQQDEEVDYLFDVPVLLAERVTGFRHDQHIEDDFRFAGVEIAAEAPKAAKSLKPWWRVW
ncbi:MAG: hypothetical protein JNK87_23245 [Bryobacterales bacterium]|nr:hypothetical protein [Bryobacterales bacterium]